MDRERDKMTDPRRKTLRALFLCISQFQWLAGIVVGLAGLYLWVRHRHCSVFFSPSPVTILPFIFIWLTGALLLLSGFLGSWVASRDSTCLQGLFVYLLVVIFCMVSTATTLLAHRSLNLDSEIQPLSEVFQKYTGSSQDRYSRALDDLQESIQCCGIHNYTDWWDTSWFKNQTEGVPLPLSCCKRTSCNMTVFLPHEYYQTGCHEQLHTVFKYILLNIVVLTLGVVFLEQIMMLVITMQLMKGSPSQGPLRQHYQTLPD